MKKPVVSRKYIVLLPTMVFLSFSGILATTCHGQDKYPSYYCRGVVIDGSLKEWPESVLHCNYEAKVFYAAGNDSAYLYVALMILDSPEQKKVQRDGLLVWLDPSGRKKKDCSVLFTIGPPVHGQGTPPPSRSGAAPQNKTGTPPESPYKNLNPLIPRQAPALTKRTGFAEGYNGEKGPGSPEDGISGFFRTDSTGALVLEARVPLKAFRQDPRNSPCMAVGCEISEIGQGKEEDAGWDQAAGPPGGGMGSDRMGGGDMGTGGRPGEGPGGEPGKGQPGSGPGQNQAKSYKIWYRFRIVPGPS